MPTCAPGERQGLGTWRAEAIALKGEPLERLVNGGFRVPRGPVHDFTASGLLSGVNNLMGRRPVIDPARCTRCFCCQEICPEGAISVRRTFLRLPERG